MLVYVLSSAGERDVPADCGKVSFKPPFSNRHRTCERCSTQTHQLFLIVPRSQQKLQELPKPACVCITARRGENALAQ